MSVEVEGAHRLAAGHHGARGAGVPLGRGWTGSASAGLCWALSERAGTRHTVPGWPLPWPGSGQAESTSGSPRVPRLLPGTLGSFPGCL